MPYVHQCVEAFVSKMFALSYGIASVEVRPALHACLTHTCARACHRRMPACMARLPPAGPRRAGRRVAGSLRGGTVPLAAGGRPAAAPARPPGGHRPCRPPHPNHCPPRPLPHTHTHTPLPAPTHTAACTPSQVHGANPADHLVHKFTHCVARGTLLAIGRPDGRLYSPTMAESWILREWGGVAPAALPPAGGASQRGCKVARQGWHHPRMPCSASGLHPPTLGCLHLTSLAPPLCRGPQSACCKPRSSPALARSPRC